MKIAILNGANLNLLGKREPEVYGHQSFESFLDEQSAQYSEVELIYKQSNVEGELINFLHQLDEEVDGFIVNFGGYTHTSVALSDAIAGIETPVVEVHISNIYAREEYRHTSITGKNCVGVITGFGLTSYLLALNYFESALRSAM